MSFACRIRCIKVTTISPIPRTANFTTEAIGSLGLHKGQNFSLHYDFGVTGCSRSL